MICINCQAEVLDDPIGTKHRNHCPLCLFSKHLDLKKPGDRESECLGKMVPVGLSFKSDNELTLVHLCLKCQRLTQNRIAGDDDEKKIMEVFESSKNISPEIRLVVDQSDIKLLTEQDKTELLTQLFGKNFKNQAY